MARLRTSDPIEEETTLLETRSPSAKRMLCWLLEQTGTLVFARQKFRKNLLFRSLRDPLSLLLILISLCSRELRIPVVSSVEDRMTSAAEKILRRSSSSTIWTQEELDNQIGGQQTLAVGVWRERGTGSAVPRGSARASESAPE